MTAKNHPYDTNTADASSHSPRYRAMPDSNTTGNDEDILSDYHTWSPKQLGVFFRKRGLSEYYDTLQKHKITGQLAPLLNDDDLKQMGIDIVGDRLMFKHHLKDLSRRERYNKRIESFWEGEERIFFSDCDKTCFTCNGFCPVDPSTCKLKKPYCFARIPDCFPFDDISHNIVSSYSPRPTLSSSNILQYPI